AAASTTELRAALAIATKLSDILWSFPRGQKLCARLGRTLLSAAFDFCSFRTNRCRILKISTSKSNSRAGGQECPPHTVRKDFQLLSESAPVTVLPETRAM